MIVRKATALESLKVYSITQLNLLTATLSIKIFLSRVILNR